MEIIFKNGFKVLTSDVGYLIHDKKNDTYHERIYLPLSASTDIYDEVIDTTVSDIIRTSFKEVKEKNKSLYKIGKIVANNVMDDIQALAIKEFYDIWKEGVSYKTGQYVTHKDILYKVLADHTSQSDWTPDISNSLFANVLISLDGTPKDWVQPDSTNPYMKGDKIIFEDKTYESLIDNNTWSPSTYPAAWKEI